MKLSVCKDATKKAFPKERPTTITKSRIQYLQEQHRQYVTEVLNCECNETQSWPSEITDLDLSPDMGSEPYTDDSGDLGNESDFDKSISRTLSASSNGSSSIFYYPDDVDEEHISRSVNAHIIQVYTKKAEVVHWDVHCLPGTVLPLMTPSGTSRNPKRELRSIAARGWLAGTSRGLAIARWALASSRGL